MLPAMTQQGELRANSDMMLRLLDQLRTAEETKRATSPGSEDFARLAHDVKELAHTVVRWSELQLRQANEALAAPGAADSPPLAEVQPRRLDEVLAEWRRAEIRVSQARPDDPDAAGLAAEVDRLRTEYRELQSRKHAEHAADA